MQYALSGKLGTERIKFVVHPCIKTGHVHALGAIRDSHFTRKSVKFSSPYAIGRIAQPQWQLHLDNYNLVNS